MTDTMLSDICQYNVPEDPCAVVVFGATGDLAARKILPSLYDLLLAKRLPTPSMVIGVARTKLTNEEFRARIKTVFIETGVDMTCWDDFCSRLFYRNVDYGDIGTFTNLAIFLQEKESEIGTQGNRIFHLSVPPVAYEDRKSVV